MDYQFGWLIPNEVIYGIQLQDWSMDVVAQFICDASRLMNTTHKSRVPIVFETNNIPSRRYYAFQTHKLFQDNKTDKWGATIIIPSEDRNPFVVRVAFWLARIDLYFARNMDEALDILYGIDPSLADKPVLYEG